MKRKKLIKNRKTIYRKIFTIIIILLFLGVVLAVALVNWDKIAILWKTP